MGSWLRTASVKSKTFFMVVGLLVAQGMGAAAPFAPAHVAADPLGNNGTFQLHDQATQSLRQSDNPHVCVFDFEVFGLDANQTGTVTVTPQPPTVSNGTPNGNPLVMSLATNANGDGSTAYVNDGTSGYALLDGHYKATLDNKFGTDDDGHAKTKVFWVDCPKVAPTVITHASANTVSVGDNVSDVATVTGDFNHGDVTGTVKFFVCGPSATPPSCLSGGQQDGTKTIVGGTATSNNFHVASAGTYCFRTSYTPAEGSQYLSVTHTDPSAECFTATLTGTIAVTKVVNSQFGGTATVSQFPLFVNSTQVTSGVTNSYAANQSYTVSETPNAVPGYTQASLTCTDLATGAVVGATFTLASGQHINCVIVNNDADPVLTLKKVVVNDNGGTATVANFQAQLDGANVAWDAPNALAAGVYTLSETALAGGAGYAASAWSCVGGSIDGNQLTLLFGEDATCTITNDDIAPQLTVVKHVIDPFDDSVTASDFTMNVTGTSVSNGSFPGSEQGTVVTLDAGGYSVGETGGPANYTASLSGDCSGQIAVGEQKTCTITNTRNTGTIAVTKFVDPSEGDLGLFNLLIDGHAYATNVGNGGTTDAVTLPTGTHQVSELAGTDTSLSDYDSTFACFFGNDEVWRTGDGTVSNSFDLTTNDTVHCYFFNTHRATLTVIKKAFPFNSSQSFNFTLSKVTPVITEDVVTEGPQPSILNFLGNTSKVKSFQLDDNNDPTLPNSNTSSLTPGVYEVTEDGTPGWNLADMNCGDVQTYKVGSTIRFELQAGQQLTCTFTNQKPVVPQVLGASTSDPADPGTVKQLTNTGLPIIAYAVVAMALMGTAVAVVRYRNVQQ